MRMSADQARIGAEGIGEYERLLGIALRGFIAELTLIDAGVILACAAAHHHANLGDLVASSLEHAVRPGMVRYGEAASVEFEWGRGPTIAIGMELRHPAMRAAFRVILERAYVGVEITELCLRDIAGDPAENLRRFASALEGVRPVSH